MSMTFDWGGTSRVMSDEAMDSAIFDRTLPFTDTFGLSTTSGFLKGGLGTFTRETELPPGAPTQRGMGLQPDAPAPSVGYAQERAGIAGTNDQDFAPQFETEQQFQGRRAEAGAISEETYKAAPYFRKDIPYSPEMTEPRARAQAEIRDRQKAREFFQQKRPITSFFGELTGGLPDPVNFIPVFGPAVRAAAVARVGRTAGTAAVMSGEAAISQAVFGASTAGARQQFGDDVTWQAQVTDIAMGALTGGLIGGLVGKVGGHFARVDTIKNHSKARAALDDAVAELAETGEVKLNPTSAGFVEEMGAALKPVRDFEDFIALVNEGRRPVDITGDRGVFDPRAALADPLDSVARLPSINRAEFTPLTDARNAPTEVAARKLEPEAFKRFDLVQPKRDQVAAVLEEIQTARARGVPDMRDDEALARSVASYDRQLAEIMPRVEKARRYAAERLRTSLLPGANETADTLRMLEARGGIRFRDDPEVQLVARRDQPADDGTPVRGDIAGDGGRDAVARVSPSPLDFSSPVETPDPIRVQQAARAEASIGKPETTQSFAKDVGFDPETGESAISAIAKQIEAEGRLTPDDATALKAADEGIQDASAWAETLRVATGCVL